MSSIAPSFARAAAVRKRTLPRAVAIYRLRVVDHTLDAASVNRAAATPDKRACSADDACLGVVVRSRHHVQVAVLTSDPVDTARVASNRPVRPTRIRRSTSHLAAVPSRPSVAVMCRPLPV